MEIISSTHNPLFKQLFRLATEPRERKKSGLTLFDGVSLVSDFLRSGLEAEYLVLDADLLGRVDIDEIRSLRPDLRQVVLSSALFNKISQVETAPGVILVAKPKRRSLEDFLAETPDKTPIVILETIQDPGNLGTILRSCLAFGVDKVLISSGSVDAWSPKVVRASMGACFNLQIYENLDMSQVLSELKGKYCLLATSPRADKNLPELDLKSLAPVAWLFGNESRGLSETSLSQADCQVLIPQSRQIESLNLSMATTICLYESARQDLAK